MPKQPIQDPDTENQSLSRSSVQLPSWMTARLDEIADRTFSSRSQVIRRLLAEALEREAAGCTA